ncbi:hypothetical protein DXC69_24680 [Paenibacillus polymyxa]|uniref:hypothetical protein n=1 Tax=Paenibacillus polymyxa TaxID=1406 RepID=UPI000EDC534D|nr:hypothetical protein [Paenibacillus polymyxa]RGL29738.1 hypothetical protein DXC69_24680 [Paenibacillus polymyxa]UMR34457.1 hypothetical protein MJ749_17440 [Paenibacillus polymyxa]
MLRFIDDETKTKTHELLSYFKKYRIDFDFFDIESSEDYDEDVVIDLDSEISFGLPYCDDYPVKTLGEVFETIKEVRMSRIDNAYIYISPKRILLRVDSLNREKIVALEEKVDGVFSTSLIINNQTFYFNLIDEQTNFAVVVTVMNNYDKYFPPVLYEDLFIEVTSEIQINEALIDDLIQAYMFELSSSLNIKLFVSPRPVYYELEYELQEGEENIRLRPLVAGKGNKELYQIYNACASIEDPEILVLMYTKVIEYVSQTVVRRELLESVMTKLYSPKTLSPDANYVLELEKLFDDLGNYRKDKEAIRITIEVCCDVVELKEHAPRYLKNINKMNIQSTREEKKQSLLELSNAISDTRNMIAHAKTNYKNKGYECSKDEMKQFSTCLKIVADQVIRWFSRQHDDSKVI